MSESPSVSRETEIAVRADGVHDLAGQVIDTLGTHRVRVRALSRHKLFDETIVLLVADDALQAQRALNHAGFVCAVNPVVVVRVANRVGAVARIGACLSGANVEILRSYSSFTDTEEVVAVFRTTDDAHAVHVLSAALSCDAPLPAPQPA